MGPLVHTRISDNKSAEAGGGGIADKMFPGYKELSSLQGSIDSRSSSSLFFSAGQDLGKTATGSQRIPGP